MSKFSFNPEAISISPKRPIQAEAPLNVTMELEDHPNPRYMARFKRYEPRIKDSHATKVYKECVKKYFLQIVLGFNSPEKFVVFAWGSAYHKFREVLERTYGFGPDKPKQWDEEKAKEALIAGATAGMNYWKKNGIDQEPGSKFNFMTAGRLMLSFQKAFEHWKLEKQRGQIEVVAVEQAFNVQLRDGSRTSGRFDQLVRFNGALWNRDFKTTTKDTYFYARQLEPNDQFTRYTLAGSYLAGEPVQGAIVELLFNANPTKSDTKGPTIFQLTTSRTKEQLDTFEQEVSVINRKLAINRELDVWEKHEQACAFCPYHSVCTEPTEQAEMEKLEQHFIVKPWDNTKVGVTED